ncbi:importin subunit alpha-4-like [Rutidosis leptorrhynchoides]|uniref:importin subunit alpha-4-like n=1 Tax=Rutidosis leptorrhynchoides TaxID=125765 RepID=UPI003A9A2761
MRHSHLFLLTSYPSPSVIIPALRTVENIVAGDDLQTQAVIEAGLIAPLVNLLQIAEFDIKKESAWAILNATSCGNNDQIK